jgi:hypothetical protein
MTTLNELNAISPIDGRYRNKTLSLAPFFSEEALIKYRVLVEIEYFIALCEVPLPQLKGVNPDLFDTLRNIYKNFSTEDALWIKETEKVTNHDVKAVEYFIKDAFEKLGLSQYSDSTFYKRGFRESIHAFANYFNFKVKRFKCGMGSYSNAGTYTRATGLSYPFG